MANTTLLKKLYLFSDLSAGELDKVASAATEQRFGPGDEIFAQGDRAKALFIIQSGSVKISQTAENGESIEITRIGAGSHFGEMSFLDSETRSATATALEQTTLVVTDYDKLSAVMIDHPGIAVHFYRQFAHFLCGRLRATTKDLSFSRSKILSHF